MKSENIFVIQWPTKKYPAEERNYIRKPFKLNPSACTPLFLTAFEHGAGCCIHTHSQWAVLVTLLVERDQGPDACFEISTIEQIKGIPRGKGKGMLGYHDTLRIPIIENTAFEEDLTSGLEAAMNKYPDTYAVLVRRHGMYEFEMACSRMNPSLTKVAVTYGAITLPRRRLSVRVWTICSSWRWKCTSWASRGSSRLERDKKHLTAEPGVVEVK